MIQEGRKMNEEVIYVHKIIHFRTEMYVVAGGCDAAIRHAFYERRKRHVIVLSRMYTEIISIQHFAISSTYQILQPKDKNNIKTKSKRKCKHERDK
jgi:hypothetical protein